jgi:hypothetical protein
LEGLVGATSSLIDAGRGLWRAGLLLVVLRRLVDVCAEPVGACRPLRKLLAVLLLGYTYRDLLGRRLLVRRRTALAVDGLVPLRVGFVVYRERFFTSAARTLEQHSSLTRRVWRRVHGRMVDGLMRAIRLGLGE